MPRTPAEDAEAIWLAIEAANTAWMTGRPKDVGALFHEDAVMLSARGETLVRGRKAMVQSFVDYVRRVKTHRFDVLEREIRIIGDGAVVNYVFSVRYEIEGQVTDDLGRVVLFFVRTGGKWLAVWRMLIMLTGGSA